MNKVFVYGTLKRGHYNHRLLVDSDYVGDGSIEGFDIYDLGCYPGVVQGTRTVHGEVFSVTDDVLRHLDCLEGYNKTSPEQGLYNKQTTSVQVGDTSHEALVYTYNGCTASDMLIGEGTWPV